LGIALSPVKKDSVEEIVVTSEMVSAGISELYDHSFSEGWEYIIERVFRGMAYASDAASATKESR
jgi:hypothetical protein